MKASKLSAVWLCFWIAGCGGGCGGAIEAADDTSETSESTDRPGPSGGETTEPVEPVDPGPRPVLRVVGAQEAHAQTVAIRIENRGTEPTELAGTIGLQRQQDDGFVDVAVQLDLRYSCEDSAPECVTLAPGGAYLPPVWLGTLGDAQCVCERCVAAPAGDYRFVVRSCNGAHTIEGEPFTLGAD